MRQPSVYGKYLLLERISVGGMAEVFKAKSFGEEGFEKILAIKRILPSMAEDDEFIEMFIDEAKICGQLSHPNIAQIYELGKVEDSHFIAMEYIWGKDVLQIQNRFRRLRQKMPLPMAAYIASRVCEGLDYAHRKKDEQGKLLHIIHRDVSPQNVLASYAGEIKLIDFGIAKARSRSSKTQAGVLKGKFGYMSPEQVRALPLDHRSDIFAIGTLLFEMATGERLFTGESDFATLEKVRNAQIPMPSKVDPGIHPEMENIILKALKRDAEDRFQWAGEMQEALTNFYMSSSPIFSAKILSNTVSTLFEAERQREEATIEEYRRIQKEDLEKYTRSSPSRKDMAISLIAQSAQMKHVDFYEPSEERSAALVEKPTTQDELGLLKVLSGSDLFEVIDESVDHSTPATPVSEEQRTHIFTDEETDEPSLEHTPSSPSSPEAMPAEPTFIFNVQSGQLMQVAEQATVIFSQEKGNGNGSRADAPEQGPTVIFDAGLSAAIAAGYRDPYMVAGISATMPVSLEMRPPSMVKDILIGVLLALVVILGIVLWKGFPAVTKDAPRMATLVITAAPPRAAEVMLNGQSKGTMTAGIPYTLKDVPPGEHQILIRAKGAEPISEKILLSSGDVKVLSLVFRLLDTPAHLLLEVTPSGARVLLDGVEVSEQDIKSYLRVDSGTTHELKVRKEGYKEATLRVELGPGKKEKKIIVLEAEGKARTGVLYLTSKPLGAEVMLDDVRQGTTPLLLRDLLPTRHKITLTLAGYGSRTSFVELSAGKRLEKQVNLNQLGESPEGAKEPASKDRPPQGKQQEKKPEKKKASVSTLTKMDKQKTKGEKPKSAGQAVAQNSGTNEGYLVANTIPWAKVFVDGKDTGKNTPIAPRARIPLSPGNHKVTFEVEGKKFHFPITITAGGTLQLIKKLPVE